MKRIGISTELERRLRNDVMTIEELHQLIDEVRCLLDARPQPKAPGLPYALIVATLREGLGDRLAVPEKPHVSWIVRQVNRVKELGLDVNNLKELGTGAAKVYRGSVEMEFILRMATRILGDVRLRDRPEGTEKGIRVITGREDE